MGAAVNQGITLNYETSGSGPAIVLSHCLFFDSSFFRHLAPVLARTHRVISIDMRGHGRSGPSETPYTLYDLVDDAVAVLDAEGVGQAVWIGHSIGGYLSYRAALTRPERVRALVALDAGAEAEPAGNRVKYSFLKLGLQVLGPRAVAPALLSIMLGRTSLRSRAGVREECRRTFLDMRVRSVYSGVDAILGRDDLLDRMGGISVPTLIGVGEEDKTFPVRKARQVAGLVPGAELAVIPQAGHLSPIENPGPVADAVTRFLARLR